MNREYHLKFCKACYNKKFDMNQGIICGLTNQIADFDDTCTSYKENAELKKELEIEIVSNELDKKTASQGKRLANYILDIAFTYIYIFVIAIFIGIAVALIAPDSISIFEEDNTLVAYIIAIIGVMTYYTIFEYATGRTIAKYITKTKVVDETGAKPDLKTILIRSVSRLIPFDSFSFLFSDGSGWHDRISKTRVIDA